MNFQQLRIIRETVRQNFNLTEASFFKAFTKGQDFFEDGYYKYSGRNIFFNATNDKNSWNKSDSFYYREANESEFIKETDVFSGDAYNYKKYFRQQLQYHNEKEKVAKDTFMLKSYLNNDVEKNGLPPEKYTEDNGCQQNHTKSFLKEIFCFFP